MNKADYYTLSLAQAARQSTSTGTADISGGQKT